MKQHVCASDGLKIVLCIEFQPLQKAMSNKVVASLDMYSIGAPSIRYIIYSYVLMLFHIKVSLIEFLSTFANVFDQGTPQWGSH